MAQRLRLPPIPKIKKNRKSDTRPTTGEPKSFLTNMLGSATKVNNTTPAAVPAEVRSSNTRTPSTNIAEVNSYNQVPHTVVAGPQKVIPKLGWNTTLDFSSLTATTREVSTFDKESVISIVVERFFPEVKFLHRDTQLAWDESEDSFCQFFIRECHVPLDVNRREWWFSTRKIVLFTLSQTRNDRNTAVKNAFVGKCNAFMT